MVVYYLYIAVDSEANFARNLSQSGVQRETGYISRIFTLCTTAATVDSQVDG